MAHRSIIRVRALAGLAVALILFTSLSAGSLPYEESSDDLDRYSGRTVTGIEFKGLKKTKTYIVTREVRSEVGNPLDPELVRKDAVRLRDLPVFGAVNVNVISDGEGVILEFDLHELPWIIPHPSINYTEENGFSFGGGVKSMNLFGRAIFLSAKALLGGVNTFTVSLHDPWIAGNRISAGTDFGHTMRQNELLEFEETKDLYQICGGMWIGETGRLSANGGYIRMKSDREKITLDPFNKDLMYFGKVVFGYDSRDSRNAPRRGWENDWVNLSYFGGDAGFWTIQFDINRYQPTWKNQSIAIGPLVSFQTGIVGEDIPPYYQYFMGGSNSIRGYKLEELGKELYGKNQLLVNLEYRWNFFPMRDYKIINWKVSGGLQLAAFADAGLAWSRDQDFSLDRTRFGFGVGLRAMLPVVETLRFDMGISQYGDVVFNFGVRSIFYGRRQKIR